MLVFISSGGFTRQSKNMEKLSLTMTNKNTVFIMGGTVPLWPPHPILAFYDRRAPDLQLTLYHKY